MILKKWQKKNWNDCKGLSIPDDDDENHHTLTLMTTGKKWKKNDFSSS